MSLALILHVLHAVLNLTVLGMHLFHISIIAQFVTNLLDLFIMPQGYSVQIFTKFSSFINGKNICQKAVHFF